MWSDFSWNLSVSWGVPYKVVEWHSTTLLLSKSLWSFTTMDQGNKERRITGSLYQLEVNKELAKDHWISLSTGPVDKEIQWSFALCCLGPLWWKIKGFWTKVEWCCATLPLCRELPRYIQISTTAFIRVTAKAKIRYGPWYGLTNFQSVHLPAYTPSLCHQLYTFDFQQLS